MKKASAAGVLQRVLRAVLKAASTSAAERGQPQPSVSALSP